MDEDQVAVELFRDQLLTTKFGASTASELAMAPVISTVHNKLTYSADVLNIDAGATLQVYLDFSYNGAAWIVYDSLSCTAIGFYQGLTWDFLYPFARFRAGITGATKSVLFSANATMFRG
jgi:hypothetical protein